jgi:hypothetical protein
MEFFVCYRVLRLLGFPSLVKIVYRMISEAIGMVNYILWKGAIFSDGFIRIVEEANFRNEKDNKRYKL